MFFRNIKFISTLKVDQHRNILYLITNLYCKKLIETNNELLYYYSYLDFSLMQNSQTNSTLLHCFIKYAIDLLYNPLEFLKKNKVEMITYKNDSGSTPLHYLCSNKMLFCNFNRNKTSELTIEIIKLFKNNLTSLTNKRESTPYVWLKNHSYFSFTMKQIQEIEKILELDEDSE